MKNIDFIVFVNSKDDNEVIPLVFSVEGIYYTCDKITKLEGFTFGEVVEVDFEIYNYIEKVAPDQQIYNLDNTLYINYYDLQDDDARAIRTYFSSEYKEYVKCNSKFLNKGIIPLEYKDQTMEV